MKINHDPRADRDVWVHDNGTPLTDEERLAVTQRIVDRFDCPWCIAKAGELCFGQQSQGIGQPARDIRRLDATHIGRLGGIEVNEFVTSIP